MNGTIGLVICGFDLANRLENFIGPVMEQRVCQWPADAVLLFCALGACAGAALTAIAPGPGVAAFAIILTGWSLAGIYPAALGIAGSRFQSHSGTVFGILFAVALGGGMIIPWVAGQIGGAGGLRWVFGLIAASFASILGLSRVAARVAPARTAGY